MDQEAKAYLLDIIEILRSADEILDSTKEQLAALDQRIMDED